MSTIKVIMGTVIGFIMMLITISIPGATNQPVDFFIRMRLPSKASSL